MLFCLSEVQSKWNVNCNSKNICALKGSTVRMHCDYSHPYREDGITISVNQTFWFTKIDKDPLDLKTQEEYAGRVENRCNSDCTLTIRDVKESDSAAYKFRFVTNKPGGSYTGPEVVLSVTGLYFHMIVNTNLLATSLCFYFCFKKSYFLSTQTQIQI